MKNELKIRNAAPEDVALLLKFIKELAEYEKAPHEVTATENDLHESLFGKRHYAEALIAEYDGQAIGFAVFFHNFSTWKGKQGLYLEDLYIQPHMRGHGFGKQLLAFLAKIAKDRGCARLEWWVLNWNTPAINFYRSLDAQPMDEWTVYRLHGNALLELANKY